MTQRLNVNGSLERLERIFLVVTNHCNARCRVPFTSIVIDESQRIYPCFYLPFSVPLDVDNGREEARKVILTNPGWHEKYCSLCLQFQG